ncbi:MAG: AMP-binding protein [Candidatus Lokiarchaeota archaeon]|nr:AMP-binding protein [Candidatus Lokiarchaeota archaeon]MBD3201449.1 AMP-binding protein [Candidatus Lokiarchaeota archaeon]
MGFDNKNHKIYCAVPIFQAFSRYLVIIPAMYYNSSVILCEMFNPIKFWNDIDKFKPQGFCYLGAYLLDLMNQEPKIRDRKHSLNYAFGFGAFKKIWEAFERRFGIQIIESWSLVEAIGMTINEVGTKGGKAGSVGVPARGYELKIVDSKGNELPPGSTNIGEIVSRTRLPIELEYVNLESKSSARIGENRWVYTGDYGYKDFDNYIYFLGRQSDMIKRGNEIFFALDIERVANSHPQVLNTAVFEVPIGNTSETALKICIELKEDSNLNYSDIHHYLKQNLAYFMVPRFIEIKNNLPKNVNHLIQKFILKDNWQDMECRRNTYDTKQKKMAE